MTTAVAPGALNAADRCDRCGARAYLKVELAGGGQLLFCAHHARVHADKLKAVAVRMYDETGRLAKTPHTAPAEEH